MPTLEDLITDDLARLRQARQRGDASATKLLTSILNRRLDSLATAGQVH
ncbi:hypothetical protein [Rhodococcus globerulus]|nr:hypothetical protein [Rhodococcus globerulus]QXW04023.1 hypothetical protein KYT97_08385 [Rhodococcus globerulus]